MVRPSIHPSIIRHSIQVAQLYPAAAFLIHSTRTHVHPLLLPAMLVLLPLVAIVCKARRKKEKTWAVLYSSMYCNCGLDDMRCPGCTTGWDALVSCVLRPRKSSQISLTGIPYMTRGRGLDRQGIGIVQLL